MVNLIPVIAVDGPSGVGKGTLCQLLAQHFHWHLLDSGAIYRVLGFWALQKNIALDNETQLAQEALALPLSFISTPEFVKVMLDNNDISSLIRNENIGAAASQVASLPQVREALLQRQRAFRVAPGLIADGRDMGTIVFPDAPVKIFLDASAQARAERRMNQLREKGICAKFGEVFQEIADRDHRDRNRTVAPLKPASDAFVIDSTTLTINEVFEKALTYINANLK